MSRAETLQQLAKLCGGHREGLASRAVEPSGVQGLDAVLPGGGWQSGTIVELIPMDIGIGELSLITSTLARISKSERHIAFVSPPFIPYAPSLTHHGVRLDRLLVIEAQSAKDLLWSVEQTLRCRSFGAVLAWPTTITDRDLRRLQLAAEAGGSIGFLYRSPDAAREPSPAAVRLRLHAEKEGALHIDILKCRGARGGVSLRIARDNRRQKESENEAGATFSDYPLSINR